MTGATIGIQKYRYPVWSRNAPPYPVKKLASRGPKSRAGLMA